MKWAYFSLLYLLAVVPLNGQSVSALVATNINSTYNGDFYYNGGSIDSLDQGKLLYLGRSSDRKTMGRFLRMIDPVSGRQFIIEAPLAVYIEKESLFSGKSVMVEKLHYYDTTVNRAGIECSFERGKRKVAVFLIWDIAQNRITNHHLLSSDSDEPGGFYYIKGAGYDRGKRTFYLARFAHPNKKGQENVIVTPAVVMAIGEDTIRTVATVTVTNPREIYLFSDQGKIFFTEYAESFYLTDYGFHPRGHFLDIATGAMSSFPIPVTPYGITRDASGSLLYIASSETGLLWEMESATGKLRKTWQIGTHGHAIGFVNDAVLVWIQNHGLLLIDVKKVPGNKKYIPMATLFPGFSHTDGSLVLPGGRLIIKNGDDMYNVLLR